MKKSSKVTLAVAGAVAIAGGAIAIVATPSRSASTKRAPVAEVSIAEFAFGPLDLEVAAGATITWTNRDDVAHSVVTRDGVLASSDLDPGGTYAVVVTEPATIEYYCGIHPSMRGTIVVTRPAAT